MVAAADIWVLTNVPDIIPSSCKHVTQPIGDRVDGIEQPDQHGYRRIQQHVGQLGFAECFGAEAIPLQILWFSAKYQHESAVDIPPPS